MCQKEEKKLRDQRRTSILVHVLDLELRVDYEQNNAWKTIMMVDFTTIVPSVSEKRFFLFLLYFIY